MAKGFKTGGREQGTPNQLTKELRSILKNILARELESIPDNLNKLEPKDRLEMLIKLIPFVLPKVEAINMSDGEALNWINE